jgi:hypothetical protein
MLWKFLFGLNNTSYIYVFDYFNELMLSKTIELIQLEKNTRTELIPSRWTNWIDTHWTNWTQNERKKLPFQKWVLSP